jgi:ankyrin repeat protein
MSDHTVLFVAVLGGDVEMVEVLLRYGADVNARCSNGKTPLTWARRGDSKAVIEMLRGAGGQEGIPDPPPRPYVGGYPH